MSYESVTRLWGDVSLASMARSLGKGIKWPVRQLCY